MIAIKDTKMPSSCGKCRFCGRFNPDEDICKIDGHIIKSTLATITQNRDSNCPLVEIQERKVGKWLGDKAYPICSKCNCNIIEEYISCSDYAEMYKPMKYCPNCGADMRGRE